MFVYFGLKPNPIQFKQKKKKHLKYTSNHTLVNVNFS